MDTSPAPKTSHPETYLYDELGPERFKTYQELCRKGRYVMVQEPLPRFLPIDYPTVILNNEIVAAFAATGLTTLGLISQKTRQELERKGIKRRAIWEMGLQLQSRGMSYKDERSN